MTTNSKQLIDDFVRDFRQTSGAVTSTHPLKDKLNVGYLTQICTAMDALKGTDDSSVWQAKKTLLALVVVDAKIKQALSQISASPIAKEIFQEISRGGKDQQSSKGFDKNQKGTQNYGKDPSKTTGGKGQQPFAGGRNK